VGCGLWIANPVVVGDIHSLAHPGLVLARWSSRANLNTSQFNGRIILILQSIHCSRTGLDWTYACPVLGGLVEGGRLSDRDSTTTNNYPVPPLLFE
jgi:hypothetical protein